MILAIVLNISILCSQTLIATINGKALIPIVDVDSDGVNELINGGDFTAQMEYYDGATYQLKYTVDIPMDEILISNVMEYQPVFDFNGDGQPDLLGRKQSVVNGNDVGFQIRSLIDNSILFEYEDPIAASAENSFVKVYRNYLDGVNSVFIIAYRMFDANNVETQKTLIFTDPSSLAVVGGQNIPSELRLNQNYPNPFNPVTNIPYKVNNSGRISIKIYDINGRLVDTLVNKYHEVGSYSVLWNPIELSSGQYFYLLEIDGQPTLAKKAIFLK